jgi:hypothetical protein
MWMNSNQIFFENLTITRPAEGEIKKERLKVRIYHKFRQLFIFESLTKQQKRAE